jgi:CheY-like chemotaxis protein
MCCLIACGGKSCALSASLIYSRLLEAQVRSEAPESCGLVVSDGASILLVDDNDDARVTVARILEMSGYNVVQAANARAASALLKEQAPDLVITDIFMPEGDGFEMLNELRDREPRIPVIAISGGGNQQGFDVLALAGRLGAKNVLYKPFARRQLLDAIAEALA